MDNILIILTCTVNVNLHKYWLYQTNATERINCYLKSIIQWIEKTNFKICVVENSGYTFPELKEYIEKYNNRFEIISYVENNLPIEKLAKIGIHSKGSSEVISINYAYENTSFKNTTDFVIKITCRYFIAELEQFLLENNLSYRSKGGIGTLNSNNIFSATVF